MFGKNRPTFQSCLQPPSSRRVPLKRWVSFYQTIRSSIPKGRDLHLSCTVVCASSHSVSHCRHVFVTLFKYISLSAFRRVHAIGSNFEARSFNPIALNIPKLRAFKLLRWMKTCASERGTMKFCMMIDIQRMDDF
jgi:hypothetical protein